MTTHSFHETTVVIGASIAGLAACAALAQNRRQVIVIEQDDLNAKGARRKTPQAAHVHALLQSGRDALCALAPGLETDLKSKGSITLKVRSQWRTQNGQSWTEPTDTGLSILSQTRPLLETVLRQHVLRLPNIHFVQGRADGLLWGSDGSIAGVQVTGEKDTLEIPAQTVVDASGRAGRSLSWLSEAGYPQPPGEESSPDVRYASALFSRTGPHNGDPCSGWLKLPQAPATRGAVLAPVEDGQWMVTAIDRFAKSMPTSPEELKTFVANLPDPPIVHLLEAETARSPVRNYRVALVRINRFDRISNVLPAGYLPIGDTIATFNPLYAQGMSVAALQAKALADAFSQTAPGPDWRQRVQSKYLRDAMRPAEWAWMLGQAVDLNYRQFQADRNKQAARLQGLLRTTFTASLSRPELRRKIDRVLHLLDPPERLAEELAIVA